MSEVPITTSHHMIILIVCASVYAENSSAYGRDSKGARLLPVMIKDVAGLVPGAYKGRGKGE
jgi:ribosome-binding ATPase